MPRYQLFRLSDSRREAYRNAAPKPGETELRGKHYEPAGEIDALSPYHAWQRLQETASEQEAPEPEIGVGDVLRDLDQDQWMICNYWGFDPVRWSDEPPLTQEQMQALT